MLKRSSRHIQEFEEGIELQSLVFEQRTGNSSLLKLVEDKAKLIYLVLKSLEGYFAPISNLYFNQVIGMHTVLLGDYNYVRNQFRPHDKINKMRFNLQLINTELVEYLRGEIDDFHPARLRDLLDYLSNLFFKVERVEVISSLNLSRQFGSKRRNSIHAPDINESILLETNRKFKEAEDRRASQEVNKRNNIKEENAELLSN